MINYKMILQYDGSRYSGWQVQGNTEQTIQGKLQSVLEKMTGEEIEIHGSGRTDAGVHAMGQVANFKLQSAYEPEEIKRYCNQYLPEDIVVLEVSEVPLRFHSRLNAVNEGSGGSAAWNPRFYFFLRQPSFQKIGSTDDL